MKSLIFNIFSLLIVTIALTFGASAQDRPKKGKKVPPKEGRPPVVIPKKKQPPGRPEPKPDQEDLVVKGFMAAPLRKS